MINEANEDATTEINGWFRKVTNDWQGLSLYPTLAFCSYVSGGLAKINKGYYDNWIKAGATEKAAEAYDILAIFKPAITFSNLPALKTKDANSLNAAIQAELKKGTQSVVVYSPIGTGMPQGQDAEAIKKLSAKTSTYPYYDYKLKKNVTGGVPCADTTYTGPGKGTLYQLALETAVKYM
jgi:hypothetical protein